jgi:hypothetical protein
VRLERARKAQLIGLDLSTPDARDAVPDTHEVTEQVAEVELAARRPLSQLVGAHMLDDRSRLLEGTAQVNSGIRVGTHQDLLSRDVMKVGALSGHPLASLFGIRSPRCRSTSRRDAHERLGRNQPLSLDDLESGGLQIVLDLTMSRKPRVSGLAAQHEVQMRARR